jgi:hypothetical protein
MTTKLIAILILVAVLWGGWKFFFYWEHVKNEEVAEKKQAAAAALVGDQLPGVPYQLEASLRTAKEKGAETLGGWLKTYGASIQDPRKGWVELDYCVLLSRQNTEEARRIFAEVKRRTPESSPIWPRIKQLEKTYE